jgi:saccharopine dehydrogenase-like NADP-dependent oxidoreductase
LGGPDPRLLRVVERGFFEADFWFHRAGVNPGLICPLFIGIKCPLVRGKKDGEVMEFRLESIQHPYEKWDLRCGSFTVGFPVGVAAKMLASSQIEERGAMGSERAIQPEISFKALAERGLEVTVASKHRA